MDIYVESAVVGVGTVVGRGRVLVNANSYPGHAWTLQLCVLTFESLGPSRQETSPRSKDRAMHIRLVGLGHQGGKRDQI